MDVKDMKKQSVPSIRQPRSEGEIYVDKNNGIVYVAVCYSVKSNNNMLGCCNHELYWRPVYSDPEKMRQLLL